jgi:hypothetical protein
MTMSPKKPYTTEGIPASRSMAGLIIFIERTGAEPGQEYRRQDSDGHAQDDGACGDADTAQNHRQNTEQIAQGLPAQTRQEVGNADFKDGGHSVDKQKEADQAHRQDGDAGADQEDDLHQTLCMFSHCTSDQSVMAPV